MEAKTLKINKQIKKGKLKKTMKHVICRPDPNFWPQISEDESITLIEELNRLKVNTPDFTKPLWSELSQIPKELRPKPPPIPKVQGLIFGITECHKAIEIKECVGILIDVAVNPKSIVQPLIETCSDNSIPVLCLKHLRTITKINFCIPTSVLGVKQNCLPNLEKKIVEISNCHKPPTTSVAPAFGIDEQMCITTNRNVNESNDDKNETILCPYLYRTSKTIRIFSPSIAAAASKESKEFIGQDFIKVSNNLQKQTIYNKQYMKMLVKKISSNPNRRKITKGTPKEVTYNK